MSARRQARASAVEVTFADDGGDTLAALRTSAAKVWHNQAAYRRFMAARGWTLPPSERVGGRTHPANRRNAAADAWGVENGITGDSPHQADWHRLRAMGFLDP